MEEDGNSIVSREKLDQVATWVGSTVSSAFFNSLERFSCVNVTTDDDDDEEEHDDQSQAQAQAQAQAQIQTQTQTQNDVTKLPV